MAHIIVSKFADALTLYRQQKIFARLGVDLQRAIMAKWAVKAAVSCAPIVELLHNDIRPFVLGRKNWLFAGSPSGAEASATFFIVPLMKQPRPMALSPTAIFDICLPNYR